MQDLSDVPADEQTTQTRILLCVACGSQFEAIPTQPRLRCPNCQTVGYADRAGRNLVSTDWECLECDTRNPEITNFCYECSAGLTSRCLRCEAPVYTSVCQRCGGQQDKLLRMQIIEQERAEKMPFQRSVLDAEQRRLDAERAKQEKQEARERQRMRQEPEPVLPPVMEEESVQMNSGSWQSMWPQVDRQMRVARQQRAQRLAQQRQDLVRRFMRKLGNRAMMVALVLGGIVFLLYQWRESLPGWLAAFEQTSVGADVIGAFNGWYSIMQSVLAGRGTVDTASPEYAVFFAVTVFGFAAIPVLVYLLGRVVRWVIQ